MTDLLQPVLTTDEQSDSGHPSIPPAVAAARRPPVDALGVAVAVVLTVVYGRIGDASPLLGGEGTIAQILSVAVGFAIFWRIAVNDADPGAWRLALAVLGSFFCLTVTSVLYAENHAYAVDDVGDLAKSALIFLIVVAGVTNAAQLRMATWAVIAATTIVGTVNIFQQLTHTFGNSYWQLATSEAEAITSGTVDFRSAGPSLGPNGFALMLIFALPLAIDRFLHEDRRGLRLTAALSCLVIVASLLFTYSRNGFLNLVLLGLMVVYFYRINLLYAFIGMLAFGSVIAVASPDAFIDRIATLTQFVDSDSAGDESLSSGRQSEYIVALQIFADHPVAGVGVGNYPHHYLSYSTELGLDDRREDRGAHSLYLQFAAELGVMGILWLATILLVLFRRLNGTRRRLAAAGLTTASHQMAAYLMAFTLFFTFSLLRHLSIPRYFMVALAFSVAAPYAISRRE